MTNELFIAALHRHLSHRVLLDLVLSKAFASAEKARDVLACIEPMVPTRKFQALLELPLERDAEDLGETFEHKGIRVVLASSPEYPVTLLQQKRPPPVLYIQGSTAVLRTTGFGICGSRKASHKGINIAGWFGAEVAKLGLPEVSGYAKGVDTAAHLGALEAEGVTIVVLAEGILHFSLKKAFSHLPDASSRMVAVSEFHPARPWSVHSAMQRNSTICALSHAMVVVEAQATGGTLNAGLECLRQGKPLLVVQFGNEENMPAGNVNLIKRGGMPVGTHPELAKQLKAVMQSNMKNASQSAQQLELSVPS